MIEDFHKSLGFTLVSEGSWSDNPEDPGGATMKGVIQHTYGAYRVRKGLAKQSVRMISDAEVADIYLHDFWRPCGGDALPTGLDYAVFDYAVNSGVSRAVKALQGVVGAKVDGIMGENTLAAVRKFETSDVIDRLCRQRMGFLRSLKTWPTFGKGWTRRVMGNLDGMQADDVGVIDRASLMARGAKVPPPAIIKDGAGAKATGPKTIESSITAAISDPSAMATAGSIITAALTAGSGDGPLSWAIAAVLVLGAVAGVVWIMRRKSA